MKDSKRNGTRGGPQAFLERVRSGSSQKPAQGQGQGHGQGQGQGQQRRPGGGQNAQAGPSFPSATGGKKNHKQRKKGAGLVKGGGAKERRRTFDRDSDLSSQKPAMRGRAGKKSAGARTVQIHGEVQKNSRGF